MPVLSINPYPNLEAIDPLSSSEKNQQKRKILKQVEAKPKLQELKEKISLLSIGQKKLLELLWIY